jgi:hypothetical protein
LAGHATLETAVDALAAVYGRDVHVGMSMDKAQHAVASTLLWHLRVLAGWVPTERPILRVLAGGFEIANVDEGFTNWPAGRSARPSTSAPSGPRGHPRTCHVRRRPARDPAGRRGAAGADTPSLRLGMRLSWAARVARPSAMPAGGVRRRGDLTAREVFLEQRTRTTHDPVGDVAARIAMACRLRQDVRRGLPGSPLGAGGRRRTG